MLAATSSPPADRLAKRAGSMVGCYTPVCTLGGPDVATEPLWLDGSPSAAKFYGAAFGSPPMAAPGWHSGGLVDDLLYFASVDAEFSCDRPLAVARMVPGPNSVF